MHSSLSLGRRDHSALGIVRHLGLAAGILDLARRILHDRDLVEIGGPVLVALLNHRNRRSLLQILCRVE